MILYSFCKAEQSFNSDFYYIQLRGTNLKEYLTRTIKVMWYWLCFRYSLKVSEICFLFPKTISSGTNILEIFIADVNTNCQDAVRRLCLNTNIYLSLA